MMIRITSLGLLLLGVSVVQAKEPTVGYEKERPRWEKVIHPYYSTIWVADGRSRPIIWRASEVPQCIWNVTLLQKTNEDEEKLFYNVSLKSSDAEDLPGGRLKFRVPVPKTLSSGKYYIGVECVEEQIELRGEHFQIVGKENCEGKSDRHIKVAEERLKKTEDYYRNLNLEHLQDVRCTIPVLYKPTRPEFDRQCGDKACIIRGITDHWPAHKKWDLSKLEKDARLSLGIDLGENSVAPGLIKQLWADDLSKRYRSQPMVFMESFQQKYPELRDDYEVPELFRDEEDMFSALPNDARLDWHWLIVAPKRSGSFWHVDPANTTAWNALISGKKYWVTYPPEVNYVPGMRHNDPHKPTYGDSDDSTWFWFSQTLPHIKPRHRPQECIQMPGDIIFMPEGWWHAVLNIEDTVAVTQNFLRRSSRRATVEMLKRENTPTSRAILQAFAAKYGDTFPGMLEESDYKDTNSKHYYSEDLDDIASKLLMGEKLRELGMENEISKFMERQ